MQKSNAMRFIDAYNKVDKALRERGSFKPSLSYTDVVRRSVQTSAIVRRYEDELLDFGRLRNSIVHRSDSTKVIAEPHDDVVSMFEHIALVVSTPPLATKVCVPSQVANADEPLKAVMMRMVEHGYSNMPVLRDNTIIGVVNNKSIVEFLARDIENVKARLDTAKICDVLGNDNRHYAVCADCTVDKILDMFTQNRKLSIVILTKNGTASSQILGVLTTGNILDINKLINNE